MTCRWCNFNCSAAISIAAQQLKFYERVYYHFCYNPQDGERVVGFKAGLHHQTRSGLELIALGRFSFHGMFGAVASLYLKLLSLIHALT